MILLVNSPIALMFLASLLFLTEFLGFSEQANQSIKIP